MQMYPKLTSTDVNSCVIRMFRSSIKIPGGVTYFDVFQCEAIHAKNGCLDLNAFSNLSEPLLSTVVAEPHISLQLRAQCRQLMTSVRK